MTGLWIFLAVWGIPLLLIVLATVVRACHSYGDPVQEEGAMATGTLVTTDDALRMMVEAARAYREAALVEAGHPVVRNLQALRWSASCGHSWDELQSLQVTREPDVCPWCYRTEQLAEAEREPCPGKAGRDEPKDYR